MKRHAFLVLCLVVFAGVVFGNNVFAEEYQSSQDISFSFTPTIGATVSSDDLTIGSLAPGSYSESNIITVTATSNAVGGYQLNSTIGNTTYNYTDLRISSSDTSHIFSNLGSSSASSLVNLGNSKWGYSYSTSNSGSAWRSGDVDIASPNPYGGYTDTSTVVTHANEYSPGSSLIRYKIAASASPTQAAGTYQNVVNFIAIAKPVPAGFADAFAAAGKTKYNNYYKIQDMTTNICNAVDQGAVGQVIDTRDDGVYLIGKLVDNKCWMVSNLDLAGGTALSSDDTDFDSNYTLPTTDGWTVNNGKLILPASDTSGFSISNYAYVANSNSTSCSSSSPCYSYYSWDAATVGSGRSINTDGSDAPYSLCPKGWRLPNTSRTDTSSDFRALLIALGGSSSETNYTSSDNGIYLAAQLRKFPNNFLVARHYVSGSFNTASYGRYWSATSYDGTSARYLYFLSSGVSTAANYGRNYGLSVRCVAK